MKQINHALDRLADLTMSFDEGNTKYFGKLKKKTPQEIADDLNLWGGPGSFADQGMAGMDREMARAVESAMIELGEALRSSNAANSRMDLWVDTFKKWRDERI